MTLTHRAVHRHAHDVAQDRARRSDERAGDDQEVVRQHEPRGGGRPAGVAVQHRDDDGHVPAADRGDQVNAEHEGERGHAEKARVPVASGPRRAALGSRSGRSQAATSARFNRCRPGRSSGFPLTLPRSFRNATTDPENVTAPTKTPIATSSLCAVPAGIAAGLDPPGLLAEPHEHRRRADEAVEDRDELRHLRHRDPCREDRADARSPIASARREQSRGSGSRDRGGAAPGDVQREPR